MTIIILTLPMAIKGHLLRYLTTTLMNTDMAAMPSPLPDTRMISMNSLFLLKYWPTIKVAGSRVIATPTPKQKSRY